MPTRSKDKRFSFIDDDTRAVLFDRWQAIRRCPGYGPAVQTCLQGIQALHASWGEQLHTLGAQELSPSSPGWSGWNATVRETAHRYRESHSVLQAIAKLSRILRSDGSPRDSDGSPRDSDGSPRDSDGSPRDSDGSPRDSDGSPRDSDAGIPARMYKRYKRYKDMYVAMSSLCRAEKRDFLPPLASFERDWRIRIPLDPAILSLPSVVAFSVFQTDYDIALSWLSSEEVKITFSIRRSGVPKSVLLEQFDTLLQEAQLLLPPEKKPRGRRKQMRPSRKETWRVYDLLCAGTAPSVIAQQLWGEEFKNNPTPYHGSNKSHHPAIQRVRDLRKGAEKLIKNAQP